MKEKAKQLLTESSKIDGLTLLFEGEVVNEVSEPGAVATGSGGYLIIQWQALVVLTYAIALT